MGCGSFSDIKIQTFFPLERQQINQSVEPTILILHQSDIEFSNTHGKLLKQKFPSLQILKSKDQLQEYTDELKNNVVAIFCTNIGQLKEYQSLKNIKVFDKIILLTTFRLADKNAKKQSQQRRKQTGFRFHKLLEWNNDINLLVKQFEKAAKFRNIFFCHTDAGRINRSNLTYNYIMNTQQNFEKAKFIQWLDSENEEDLIEQINKLTTNEASKYLIQQILVGNKALIKALDVIKKTINPALLLHFGWFYKIISNFIKFNYYQNIKTIYKPGELFSIWIKAQQQEIALFNKSEGQNFMFNGFITGYLKQSNINLPGEKSQYIKFQVNIPNMPYKQFSQYSEQCRMVDQGFYIHQGRVIFNVMNYFRFDKINNEARECDVLYSPISRQHMLRKTQYRYSKDATTADKSMMKLFDVYLLNRRQINTQSDLFFYLQMYGSYKNTYQKIAKSFGSFGGTGSTLASKGSKYVISQAYEGERIGQADESLGNIDQAIKRYTKMPHKVRGLVMKQLYFYSQKENKNDAFADNQKQIQKILSSNLIIMEPKQFLHFIIKALSAQMKIINNSFVEAQKCINECMTQYQKYYSTTFKTDPEKNIKVNQDDRMYPDSIRLTFLYSLILQIQHKIATIKKSYDEMNLLKSEWEQINESLDGIHIKKILDERLP